MHKCQTIKLSNLNPAQVLSPHDKFKPSPDFGQRTRSPKSSIPTRTTFDLATPLPVTELEELQTYIDQRDARTTSTSPLPCQSDRPTGAQALLRLTKSVSMDESHSSDEEEPALLSIDEESAHDVMEITEQLKKLSSQLATLLSENLYVLETTSLST